MIQCEGKHISERQVFPLSCPDAAGADGVEPKRGLQTIYRCDTCGTEAECIYKKEGRSAWNEPCLVDDGIAGAALGSLRKR